MDRRVSQLIYFAPNTKIDVHVIGVDPKHQGRGAGRAFVQWALDTGEACGVPVYFESSPSTVKLYEKMGFVRLKEKISHKGTVLGLPVFSVDVPLMVKMPSIAGGITFEQWREAGYPKFGSKIEKKDSAVAAASTAVGSTDAKVPVQTSSSISSEHLKGGATGPRKHWWRRLLK